MKRKGGSLSYREQTVIHLETRVLGAQLKINSLSQTQENKKNKIATFMHFNHFNYFPLLYD